MRRIGQGGEDWSAPVTPEMGDKPVEEEDGFLVVQFDFSIAHSH